MQRMLQKNRYIQLDMFDIVSSNAGADEAEHCIPAKGGSAATLKNEKGLPGS